MNELDAILKAWSAGGEQCRGAVLATVVHVEGSAYRRPGARMLLLSGGEHVGSISGGCLEGDLCRKAWWFTEDGRPAVRVYDTRSEDDAVWEFGLGCSGVVHVLLERLGTPGTEAAMQVLARCRAARGEAVMMTVIGAGAGGHMQVGDRLWRDEEGTWGGTLAGSAREPELRGLGWTCLSERKNCLVRLPDGTVFVEWVWPPVPLVIFGAGHDAVPLVAAAKNVGWHVTVVDGRSAYARPDRFPGVDRVVLSRSGDPLAGVKIGPDTAVVLMTHSFPQDTELLRQILPRNPHYLGLLGPRSRAERLFAEVGAQIARTAPHAPVGLDIGADTPEEIAVSIVAEILAVLAGRPGGPLRHHEGRLHDPVVEVGPKSAGRPGTRVTAACGLA